MKDEWYSRPKDEAIETAELLSPFLGQILGRELIKGPLDEHRAYLSGKRVLVTGAAGSIGWTLSSWLCTARPELLALLDSHENSLFRLKQDLTQAHPTTNSQFILGDVRHERRMESIIRETRPDVILHLAAYKHVPMAEEWPQEFVQVNILGTWQLALTAAKLGVKKFVYTSSDKAVNPPSVYGTTKRISEVLLQGLAANQSDTQFTVTRLVNVLGARGGVIETFARDIMAGKQVRITDPRMTRYWITMAEVTYLIVAAACRDCGGDIVLLDSGDPISVTDVARRVWQLVADGRQEFTFEQIGIRPGERLHEELAYPTEKLVPTSVPRLAEIRRDVLPKRNTLKELAEEVVTLRDLVDEGNAKNLVEHLFSVVEAYK